VEKIKNSKAQVRLPILLSLAIAGGMFIGATMFGSGSDNTGSIIKGYTKFREILTLIDRDYVDTVNTDQLVDVAITKMLENLDPHTTYISPKDVELAKTQLEGDFDGIGIEFFILKDTIQVVTPLSGGPSEMVGLRAGDKIIAVDGENVAGIKITNRDVFKKLRGPKGTKVKLNIMRRDGSTHAYTITRDKIPTHSVDVAYMVDNTTGYIKINRFAANTYNEFKESMTKLKSQGMQRMILDLRGNPGGYMDRATKMADEFLTGNKMIVYTDGKGERFDSKMYAYMKGDFEQGPVIILLDEGSASASEIVAGALQDHDRALIVGRRSFGKGLVQMPIPLSDGSELRLTISRYYTPSGRSIQKPYVKGEEEYGMDLMNRYEHGELFHADSIKFEDSLKYQTSQGRTVYGGGGIMPDIFVPFDTTMSSKYYASLINNNVLREYAMVHYDNNKKAFDKMTLKDFKASFAINDKMLAELRALGEKSGVPFNQQEFDRSKKLIQNSVKAFMARRAWGNEGFYAILAETDEVFNKALVAFDQAQALERSRKK
jgi:carboxyl-terminal processing protease